MVVNITSETVEKPRSVLLVKKTTSENILESTFSNRALCFDTLYLFIELLKKLFRQSLR